MLNFGGKTRLGGDVVTWLMSIRYTNVGSFFFYLIQWYLLWRCLIVGKPDGAGQHGDPNDKTAEFAAALSSHWCHFERFGGWFFELFRWRRHARWLHITNRYAVLTCWLVIRSPSPHFSLIKRSFNTERRGEIVPISQHSFFYLGRWER